MDKLTKQWLQAIAYDDFHEDRFGMPDEKNKQNIKKIKTTEKQVRHLKETSDKMNSEKEIEGMTVKELDEWLG